jgi:F-type H+-transporting ATPase subunit b
MIRSRLKSASALVAVVGAMALCSPVLASSDDGAAHGTTASAEQHPAAEAGDEGGHGASPNPLAISPDLAIFTAIVFLVLLAVLWKFAWGPIAEALDQREHGIAGQIEEAKRSNEDAKRLLAEHQTRLDGATEEVKGLLDQARRDAESQKQQIVTEAQQAAQAEKDRAVREIGLAKDQALQELAERSVDTAVNLAGQIVRRQLTADDHVDLIKNALPQVPRDS